MNTAPNPFTLWERRLAWLLLASTPFLITPDTVDSYLLGKLVWIKVIGVLWLALIAMQASWREFRPTSLDWPFAALLAVYGVSILLNYHSANQIKAYINLLIFIGIFFAFRRAWNQGLSPAITAWVIAATSALLAIYGILQDYGYDFAPKTGGVQDWRAQVVATLGNPNFLGGYLADTIPLIAALGLRPGARLWERILAGMVLLVAAACLTVTFCMGAFMSLGVMLLAGLAALVVARPRLRVSLGWATAYLLAISLGVGWYVAENPYNSHGRSLLSEAMESPQWRTGVGARQFNFATTRLMIDEKPLTGIGYANYIAHHIHYQGLNYQQSGDVHDRDYVVVVDQPHFLLLESAAETGPLGVFALLWLACAWTASAWRKMRRGEGETWFLWGAYLGVWVGLAHTFANFPFHVPANALLLTALAAYPALGGEKHPLRQPGAQPSPPPSLGRIEEGVEQTRLLIENRGAFHTSSPWTRGLFGLLALLVAALSYADLAADRSLRRGMETHGLTSLGHLEQARRWNPFNDHTHFMLGIRYIEAGWYDMAERSLNRAIALQENLKAHEFLARLHDRRGRIEQAIAAQERVIELNPIYWGHYRDLAAYLRKAGREQEALVAIRRAEELEAMAIIKYGEAVTAGPAK